MCLRRLDHYESVGQVAGAERRYEEATPITVPAPAYPTEARGCGWT